MAAPWRGGGPNDGWNDPPMFSYNASAPPKGHSPHRSHLNKRVAYPLSVASGSSASTPPGTADPSGALLSPKDDVSKLSPIQILPPTSSTSVHPPVPLLVPNMSPPVDTSALPPSFASAAKDLIKSETLPELLERLELDSADALRKYTKRILHETIDKLKDSIQGRSREDVQQRLGVLDDQWREDKISQGAKVKLGCLASAIQNDDLKCADALHLSLMVDHISEVSQWMVGVKRLINELKLLKPPPAMKTGEEKMPLFSPSSSLSPTGSIPSVATTPLSDSTSEPNSNNSHPETIACDRAGLEESKKSHSTPQSDDPSEVSTDSTSLSS